MFDERIIKIISDAFIKIMTAGLLTTIPLTIISFAIALVIAIIVAMVQVANIKVLKQIARFYIWIIRGTPLLVQLFVVFYGLPNLGILIDPFPAAIIVFSINEGAYAAETIRGAIEAIPKGQMEAGYCSGMTYTQIMMRIILPQALRIALPSLMNSLISMIKDTSLASNITVTEMFQRTKQQVGVTYEALILYIEVGLVYLLFCTVITKVQSILEKRMKTYD